MVLRKEDMEDPNELELYSDSDWASCKVTRRSTSSGLIFLNGCCIHSHSRIQASISLSSMEAEILAATSLLLEGIMVKQFLQFLLGDDGGLGNNQQVQMRLWLYSTSAQSFFNRLGPGRTKHLSTRLLWSQQAMRRKWFLVEKVSTHENPADLNTKPLSRERRDFLMKKIGLVSETFNHETNVSGRQEFKQIVRAITALMMSGSLQGCDAFPIASMLNPWTWASSMRWTLTTIMLSVVVVYLLNYIHKMKQQLMHHKQVWTEMRDMMNLQNHQDLLFKFFLMQDTNLFLVGGTMKVKRMRPNILQMQTTNLLRRLTLRPLTDHVAYVKMEFIWQVLMAEQKLKKRCRQKPMKKQ